MSFWYSIYCDLNTSASWKIREKSKILGTFPDTFFKMATDIIFHRFWVDLDSILGCFLVLKSERWIQKKQQKHTCKKVTQPIPGDPANSGNGSCGPLKQSKDPRTGNPDPRTGNLSGIRDTPLVPSGTVADTGSQDPQKVKILEVPEII